MSRLLSKKIAHIAQTLNGIPLKLFPTNWTSGSNKGGWHMIKMLESFHDLRSKHFRTFNFVRSRDALSHLDDTLCFVKVSMRQQQQNQNRKKQPASLPKTVSRIRLTFSKNYLTSGDHGSPLLREIKT